MNRGIFAKVSQGDTNSHDVYLIKNQGYCEFRMFYHYLNYAYRQKFLSFSKSLCTLSICTYELCPKIFETKVYFNEFVANVLGDDIGIGIFDLRGHGGF